MRWICLVGMIGLVAACSNPRMGANISVGADGIRVNPTASAQVGGATVRVSK